MRFARRGGAFFFILYFFIFFVKTENMRTQNVYNFFSLCLLKTKICAMQSKVGARPKFITKSLG